MLGAHYAWDSQFQAVTPEVWVEPFKLFQRFIGKKKKVKII
jgi:hypothetical protein